MLAENIEFLRKHFPVQLEILRTYEENNMMGSVTISDSKLGLPTMQIEEKGKNQYLHSKYDPLSEAEKLVDRIENKMNELTRKSSISMEISGLGTTRKASTEGESYQHILFYGVGMGYHIDEAIKRFPELHFSIYEPNPEVFFQFLSNRNLKDIYFDHLDNIYLETKVGDVEIHLNHFINDVAGHVLLVSLPSYERIFKEKYESFLLHYRDTVRSKRGDFHTRLTFEKRWTINSIKNFPEIIKTPNIFHDINREYFAGKPVLLVSAGPSLSEEIENIRYIKENRLAYIFSVGSAIKALLKNNIYPDCVLSYDPGENTQNTFSELNVANITSIPLIFGSTIGFKAVEQYGGPKIHMITSNDSVASTFLELNRDGEKIEQVSDAPSIAVITLELLYKLGANPIILVGQNFAFKKEQYYAEGISYGSFTEETLKRRAENKLIEVEDVYGGKVYTEAPFLAMKKQMEQYIKAYPQQIKIINTTRGGARINGTTFQHLDDVIANSLSSGIVNRDWYKVEEKTKYNLQYFSNKREELNNSYSELKGIIKQIIKILQGINENKNKGKKEIVIRTFPKLDRMFKQFTQNQFFQTFLLPMNQVRYNLMIKNISKSNELTEVMDRIKVVINEVTLFVYCCKSDYEMIQPMFNEMLIPIDEIIEGN